MPTNVEEMKINNGEPLCDVLPETNRMLFVIISGIADYARLYCEATNIIFKNTFMFQVSTNELLMRLTLLYSWTLSLILSRFLTDSHISVGITKLW